MSIRKLAFKNLRRRPVRTAMLLTLVTLLSFAVFGGSLAVGSLRSGLGSLETRLGADIIVVPNSAKSKYDLESILLQGAPGYFYMDKSYLDSVRGIEGVAQASAQYYLASVSSGCCSMPVQIIGFDPETDFSIKPWVKQRYSGELGPLEIVVGSNVNSAVGRRLSFYGKTCTVVAQLDKTGTELDNAVYANADTVKLLIQGSEEKGMSVLSQNDPDKIISSILIKVADGYDIEDVTADINIHVRRVQAVQTKTMLSGIADSLAGVSDIIRALVAVVWGLALVILLIAFTSMINERKREFAVLRVTGASRGMIARVILLESAFVSLVGGVLGAALALATVFPFGTYIEEKLSLPFLPPAAASVAWLFAFTVAIAVASASVAASHAAYRLSKVDAGQALREGN